MLCAWCRCHKSGECKKKKTSLRTGILQDQGTSFVKVPQHWGDHAGHCNRMCKRFTQDSFDPKPNMHSQGWVRAAYSVGKPHMDQALLVE